MSFDLDANGILNVLAQKIKIKGKENLLEMKHPVGTTDEDIEKMVKDAEANAEEDAKNLIS